MKRNLSRILGGGTLLLSFAFGGGFQAAAQKMVEKVILYENFGGADAGVSDDNITPSKWPAMHSGQFGKVGVVEDTTKALGRARWYYGGSQSIDAKTAASVYVPQFASNDFFHIDSLIRYRAGGADGITAEGVSFNSSANSWWKSVPLRNGYTMPWTGETEVGIRFNGATVLPDFKSWTSYAPYNATVAKNLTDEQGYIYLGKDYKLTPTGTAVHPVVVIPAALDQYLENVSKIQMLISGSRANQINTVSVAVDELDDEGRIVSTKTLTYSATTTPRLITVPVNKTYSRIYIQGWGSANNSNVTDFALLGTTGNTEIDTRTTYNWNAIYGIKPTDGTVNAGQTGNPGVSIHMIKIFAMMDGGYTIDTDPALVTGTKSGIGHGDAVTLTAAATKNGKRFMGWSIEGRDLAEVENPLTLTVTKDMAVKPLYVGDMAELAVVNENFTNWTQSVGTTFDATKNNLLAYNQGAPVANTYTTGVVNVPFRYGYTSNSATTVDFTLKTAYVVPKYGPRIYNIANASKYTGYVAIMGPNTDKGLISLPSLTGITKAEVVASVYDIVNPARALAFKVNGTFVRNRPLQTFYPETITIDNPTVSDFALTIGPGNQLNCENLDATMLNTTSSAAAMAIHNVRLYSKIAIPDKNYYKLTIPGVVGGSITGVTPTPENSTNHFMEGTQVTIGAVPVLGYGFDGWVDENGTPYKDGSNNPITTETITIAMDANKTVKPVFAQNPTYLVIAANNQGTVTSSVTPQTVTGENYTYLAGVPVILTATPIYGYKFVKWVKTIDGVSTDVTTQALSLAATDLVKNKTINLSVVYAEITDRVTITINNDFTKGSIEFNHEPENKLVEGGVLTGKFPLGETIEIKAVDGYGYKFSAWTGASTATTATLLLKMDADKTLSSTYSELSRVKLTINQTANGTIAITDSHKNGAQELSGMWPTGYQVELTATPSQGYALASLGSGVSMNLHESNENIVYVVMEVEAPATEVVVNPEFVVRQAGVVLAVNENFQDPVKWPEPTGTVSNVLGAIDFLGLDAAWDPRVYNNNLNGLLKLLAPYRVWGSQSNDNSDGPGGTKTPKTTQNLVYQTTPLVRNLKVGSSNDYVKVTVSNYAPCNNGLISKAVKEANIGNRYLGQVTPGFVALKKPDVTRSSTGIPTPPPFVKGDVMGMMAIEGLVYVEKLQIGYVSGGTQFCPGVLYAIDPVSLVNAEGKFDADFIDFYSIGQVARPDYSPYNGKYGWAASQEGMIMDQNMYVAEEGVAETKLLITAGFKKTDANYQYSDIFIHDLKVWGSPIKTTGIKDLLAAKEANLYVTKADQILHVEIEEPVKAIVIYDMNGSAVKVNRKMTTNVLNVSDLKPGIYGVHVYGVSGKLYRGSFASVR